MSAPARATCPPMSTWPSATHRSPSFVRSRCGTRSPQRLAASRDVQRSGGSCTWSSMLISRSPATLAAPRWNRRLHLVDPQGVLVEELGAVLLGHALQHALDLVAGVRVVRRHV